MRLLVRVTSSLLSRTVIAATLGSTVRLSVLRVVGRLLAAAGITELLEDINKLAPLFFNISFVGIAHEVQVKLAGWLLASVVSFSMERLFFVKVIEVFITNF